MLSFALSNFGPRTLQYSMPPKRLNDGLVDYDRSGGLKCARKFGGSLSFPTVPQSPYLVKVRDKARVTTVHGLQLVHKGADLLHGRVLVLEVFAGTFLPINLAITRSNRQALL